MDMVSLFGFRAPAFQFFCFAVVGAIGFTFTTCVVYATRGFLGPALAAVPAFLLAVTVTWTLNRFWTFRHKGNDRLLVQWLWYVMWTGPTLFINSVTYETLVLTSTFVHTYPIVGTAIGATAGMFVSFTVMRRLVFRQPLPASP